MKNETNLDRSSCYPTLYHPHHHAAHAVFGSILAGIQRYQIIANQITQIYKDTMAKITFDGQLTEMIDQAAHLKEQALGTSRARSPIRSPNWHRLPTKFIGIGLSWKNDFTGIPRRIAVQRREHGRDGQELSGIVEADRLTAADTVSETDILNLYQIHSPGNRGGGFAWLSRRAREDSDKRLVLDHATSEVASKTSLSRQKTPWTPMRACRIIPTSPTPRLLNRKSPEQLRKAHLTASMVQLMAFQAAKQAAEGYESEITRREALARTGCGATASRPSCTTRTWTALLLGGKAYETGCLSAFPRSIALKTR